MKQSKKVMTSGVGESKPFIASEEDRERLNPDIERIKDCHVNGIRIGDLPEEQQAMVLAILPYERTDEGIAEAQAGKSQVRVSVTDDELSKSFRRRAEFRATELEPWEAPDPMKELAEAYVRPGFKAKFLSPSVCDVAGTRGYEIVRNEKGDPVRLGRLMLAEMPEEKAERRNRHYQEMANSRLQEVYNPQRSEGNLKGEALLVNHGRAVIESRDMELREDPPSP